MKVYIWGLGQKCKEFYSDENIALDTVSGFVETEKFTDVFFEKPVYDISEITDFDVIVVAIKNNDSVYDFCVSQGLDLKRICYLFPCTKEKDSQKNLELGKSVFTKRGYLILQENYGIHDISWISRDAKIYSGLNTRKSFEINDAYNFYISGDIYQGAGSVDSYFWQDLWAAKKIISDKPARHYDIGSRVDGFIAHLLAADIKVNLIDIRPLDVPIENLFFTKADATNLDSIGDNTMESVSALCSLEHFGLGRYGDPIDPEACFKCFKAIEKKTAVGGRIYISVPIGREHIEFNAHRVFSTKTILDNFPNCELIEFSSTKNELYEEKIEIDKYENDGALGGARFGLFEFRKQIVFDR